jgi:hypothetical protein
MRKATTATAEQIGSGARPWLRLSADGDQAQVIFLGEPMAREVCFVDGRSVAFDAELAKKGKRPTKRFAFCVALAETLEVKVLEQSVAFFRALARLRQMVPLADQVFEVRRRGKAGDPRTTYSISPIRPLDAAERARIRELPRIDLVALYLSPRRVRSRDMTRLADVGIRCLVERGLSALPSDAQARFRDELGIADVDELVAVRADEALAVLERLEAEMAHTLRAADLDAARSR